MANALVITPEGEMYQTDIPDENGHKVLHDICEGWIDCVRNEAIVGYVNDEGLLIGLPVNVIATALFGRPLVGNCVVMGALNERGEYDGENHSVPQPLLSDEFAFVCHALISDEAVKARVEEIIAEMDLSPKFVAMDDAEFDAWLKGE
jgi:hypothetical protein